MRNVRNGIIFIVLAATAGVGVKLFWPKLRPASSSAQSTAIEIPTPTSQPTTLPSPPAIAPGYITIAPVPPPALLTPAELFQRLSPSVLKIVIHDARGDAFALGSGFIATSSGLIVTNYHVVKGAKSIKVFAEGTNQLEVEGLAGVDPEGDLALIKVK